VNEVQLIRRQIATERQHLRELAARSGQAAVGEDHDAGRMRKLSQDISASYFNYMRYYLPRERARAQAHIERIGRGASPTPDERAALAGLQQALGETTGLSGSEVAHAALTPRSACAGECARDAARLCRLIDSAERIEALAERRYAIEDWRSVARLDADSVLEERRLWAEVLRHGPLAASR
jgi:hypothetical protein